MKTCIVAKRLLNSILYPTDIIFYTAQVDYVDALELWVGHTENDIKELQNFNSFFPLELIAMSLFYIYFE